MWLQAGNISLGHHFIVLNASGKKVRTLGMLGLRVHGAGTAPQPGRLCTTPGTFMFLGGSSTASYSCHSVQALHGPATGSVQ